MSDEGELKKRIHKAYGELDDEICREECLPNIDKILDEAKKDFPFVNPNDHWFDDGFPHEDDTFGKDQLEEINKWFQKWFGHE